MKSSNRSFTVTFFVALTLFFTAVTFSYGANVSLQWDANDPTPDGYRVFARETNQSYNYSSPLWQGQEATCTLIGLEPGTTYYFVVRAYQGSLESADSAEVAYTPTLEIPNQAPVADAGESRIVHEGDVVALDGSASTDGDGSIVAYQWAQNSGSTVTFTGVPAVQASFTAPIVGLDGETFGFTLTVTDNDGSTSTDTVMVTVLKSDSTDVDGDGVADVLDMFPDDPAEWADTDGDGTGNNQDLDDDNDGMPDTWETAYGLDPLVDDAAQDADGDGMTNLEEFQSDANPIAAPQNSVPDAPQVETVTQESLVDLTPVLVTGAYFDPDNDTHEQTQWQISTENDFSTLILDETSSTQLTTYTVGEMLLESDTEYFWRVRFYDSRSGVSEWSATSSFRTLPESSLPDADTDGDGVPDNQTADETVDLNENGIPDAMEDKIRIVNTVEGQKIVGVETISDDVVLVSIKSLPSDTVSDASVKLGFGLVGFRLNLLNGTTTATVTLRFSERVSKDAQLYKYHTDTGWAVYENAVFAPNRKSVTLVLEDGGIGDEDGVVNGVIVDPSGVSYSAVDTSDSAAVSGTGDSSGGGGGCFISTGMGADAPRGTDNLNLSLLFILGMIAAGMFVGIYRTCRRDGESAETC